jgi:WD40 repeat protein
MSRPAGSVASSANRAFALSEAVVKTMGPPRVKVRIVLVLAGLLIAGGAIVGHQAIGPKDREGEPAPAAPDVPPPEVRDGKQVRLDRDGEPLPEEALTRLGTTRLRHGGTVGFLQFTPDGKTLVSQGATDGTRIWDVATGRQRHHILNDPPTEPNNGAALSPDGKTLALVGQSGIRLYEVATATLIRTVNSEHSELPVFSPDGRILAARSGPSSKQVELWDTATGRRIRSWTVDKGLIACLVFTEGGKTLITAGRNTIQHPTPKDQQMQFWDVASGTLRQQVDLGMTNPQKMALSPDGTLLAGICYGPEVHERFIRLWDAASGKEVRKIIGIPKEDLLGHWVSFTALAFAPDGNTLYAGGMDFSLIVWDPLTGKEIRRVGNNVGAPHSLAFAPDGKTLAVPFSSLIHLIDSVTGKERFPEVGHSVRVNSGEIAGDGRTVVTADYARIILWDLATGRERGRIDSPQSSFVTFQLLEEGRKLVRLQYDYKTRRNLVVQMHEPATGKVLRNLECPPAPKGFGGFLGVSPDLKTLALYADDTTLVLTDFATGKSRTLAGNGPLLHGAAFTSDGRTLVTWSFDYRVRLWDVATGRKREEFVIPDDSSLHGGPVDVRGFDSGFRAGISPDGKTLVGYGRWNRCMEFYDLTTGEQILKTDKLPEPNITSAFSPDGKTLAWGGGYEGIVHLVELATGRERHQFVGRKGGVSSLGFSPDGTMLLSCHEDTTSVVWDLTGRLHARAVGSKPLTPAELDVLWSDLAGDDAPRAYRAVRTLAVSAEAVPYLRTRLVPVRPADEKRLARLIANLDSDTFAVRESASETLADLDESARGFCRKALADTSSQEVRRRLEVLRKAQDHAWRIPSSDRLRSLRAIEALERAGTPAALQLLEGLAGGAPEARLTEEAKATLGRMVQRPGGQP